VAPLARPIRLVVLISGGGTTLVNLWERIRRGELDAEVPLVISSRAGCGGVEKAARFGIPCEIQMRKSYASTEDFSAAIFQRCREVRADLVVCAGFLALLKIPEDFRCRVMNIHPSLIPAFCGPGFHGLAVHDAVIARGCQVSGCTVHFVDDEYDHGPIISQKTVPVLPDDTPETLAARVFEQECQAYPQAIRDFASGRLIVSGSRVRLSD
jgi:formyltetrahydrofolate-dependent phosphoribosylglycinamide formyltransferase